MCLTKRRRNAGVYPSFGPPIRSSYAVYASYRPLASLEQVNRSGIDSLARRQIDEPAEERRLARTIAALRGTEDPVSLEVKAQYEENPYPRWIRTQAVFDPAAPAGSRASWSPAAARASMP